MIGQILERDRVIVLGGVAGLAALAWLALWRRASESGMGTGVEATTPSSIPWGVADLAAAALVWGACASR